MTNCNEDENFKLFIKELQNIFKTQQDILVELQAQQKGGGGLIEFLKKLKCGLFNKNDIPGTLVVQLEKDIIISYDSVVPKPLIVYDDVISFNDISFTIDISKLKQSISESDVSPKPLQFKPTTFTDVASIIAENIPIDTIKEFTNNLALLNKELYFNSKFLREKNDDDTIILNYINFLNKVFLKIFDDEVKAKCRTGHPMLHRYLEINLNQKILKFEKDCSIDVSLSLEDIKLLLKGEWTYKIYEYVSYFHHDKYRVISFKGLFNKIVLLKIIKKVFMETHNLRILEKIVEDRTKLPQLIGGVRRFLKKSQPLPATRHS